MRYKVQFTDAETIVLNNSSYRKDTRESIMSIYSYLVKYCNERGSFNISFEELHNMYIRHHKKISLTALKRRITRLKEIGLVCVEKIYKLGYYINSYKVNRTPVISNRPTNRTEEWTEEWTAQEPVEPVENTSVEVYEEKPKYKTQNLKNTIDIDNKNMYEKSYTEFMDSQEKVKEVETVINAAKELFKLNKITDKQVQETVINQLTKYFNNITIKFLDKYILTTIAKVKSDLKAIRLKVSQQKKVTKASKQLKFNQFDQRNYDYDKLESGLLGQEEVDLSECTKEQPKKQDNYIQNNNNLKFNNFDQRVYDYDTLEKELLGWND